MLVVTSGGAAHAATPHSRRERRARFHRQHEVHVRIREGRVALVFLRRRRDGRIVFKSFPHGLRYAANAGPERKVSYLRLHELLRRKG